MKYTIVLVFLLVSLAASAQDFKSQFREDLCNCFTNNAENESNLDECFEINTAKYEAEFKKMIDPDSELSPYEQGIAIGQDLFYDSQDFLVSSCDAYYEFFNTLREDSFLEMKEAFDQDILTNLTIEISEKPTADLLWSRGNLYFALEAYDRALTDFDAAISMDPTYAQANFSKAWIFERQGKYSEAIALYEEAMEETGIREMSVFIALARRNAMEKE